MILSHEHKFIYIKTYKTASTSIETALSAVCGPDDVITPSRADFMRMRPGQRAQNHRLNHPLVPRRPLLKRLLLRPERRYHPSVGYYEHMPAWRVRAYVGEEIWKSYFKFTFDRNPWDRQVSWYYYKVVLKGKNKSFNAFMKDCRAFVENYDLYSDSSGAIILNFVGRYEELADGFTKVLDHLGLKDAVVLPRINESGRDRPYRDYYETRTRAIVADWYKREIDHFGYSF